MSRELFSWVHGGAKNILHPNRIEEYGGLFYWVLDSPKILCASKFRVKSEYSVKWIKHFSNVFGKRYGFKSHCSHPFIFAIF